MKAITIFTLLILVLTGCGKFLDDSELPAELVNFDNLQIKSWDTVIVEMYSENGGSYYPSEGEASDTIDVDNDGVKDFVLFTRHNQHTGQSPHAWYLDLNAHVHAINPDYTLALSQSTPGGIQNFKVGEKVGKGYPYSDFGYIFSSYNDGLFEDQSAIRNIGDICVGIRKETGFHKYEYGYIQFRYIGYIILQRVMMGNHWTGCTVASY